MPLFEFDKKRLIADYTHNTGENGGNPEDNADKYNKNRNIISLGGGEPTIHKDFFEILKMLKKTGKEIMLLTNAIAFSNTSFFEKFCSV